MPSVPPDRGRSGLRPLDEHQVVPGIQGLPSAARVRASSQVMPWRPGAVRVPDCRAVQRRGAADRDHACADRRDPHRRADAHPAGNRLPGRVRHAQPRSASRSEWLRQCHLLLPDGPDPGPVRLHHLPSAFFSENSVWSPPHSHARRRIAMHAPCDQLRRALQLYSFPAITRNAEDERLPGQHRQHRGRHRLSLLLFGVLRMI